MKQWEYLTERNIFNAEKMDELGELGWELVAVVRYHEYTHFWFKRELPSPKDYAEIAHRHR